MIMGRPRKTPETLETFTAECMKKPFAKLVKEFYEMKQALAASRNEARGLKIRKTNEALKEELKNLRAVKRKYNKIMELTSENEA